MTCVLRLGDSPALGHRHPARAAAAQHPAQLDPQRTAGLAVQGLVDRLVRDPHRRVVGVVHGQPPGDLARRPGPGQPRPHLGRQGRVRLDPAVPGAGTPGHSTPLRSHCTVRLTATVAADLTVHDGLVPTQPRRDHPTRQPLPYPQSDLLTLLHQQLTTTRHAPPPDQQTLQTGGALTHLPRPASMSRCGRSVWPISREPRSGKVSILLTTSTTPKGSKGLLKYDVPSGVALAERRFSTVP